jgi:hypothetical protein
MKQEQTTQNATEFRRICLPYVLQEQKDGSYIALNRNYKPIGFRIEKWVDYAAYPMGISTCTTTVAFRRVERSI